MAETTSTRKPLRKSAFLAKASNVQTLNPVSPVSDETVRILEQLLDDARRGEFRGIAFVAIGPRWSYVGDVAGLAEQNPTFTAGALLTLGQRLVMKTLKSSE